MTIFSQEENNKRLSINRTIEIAEEFLLKNPIIRKEKNSNKLAIFRQDLMRFNARLSSEWLGKILILPHNKKKIANLHETLTRLELELSAYSIQLQKDKEILKQMEQTETPEKVDDSSTRDFSSWNKSPTRYSPKILSSVGKLDPPTTTK